MPRPISADSKNEQRMAEKAVAALPFAKDPVEKLRLLCLQRGASGILGLGKIFRRMDDDKSGSLNITEFRNGLKDTGLPLSDEDLSELFKIFDKDGSGNIHYDEFLVALRPPLNEMRLSLIEKAFNKLDSSGDGVVTIEDLKHKYNVKQHPDYQNGRLTEQDILAKFLAKFESNTSTDGVLTHDEFIDYYSGVSASIDEDLYFDLMMRKAWKL